MQFGSKKELDEYIEERLKGRLERQNRKATEEKEKAEREARKKALEDQEKYQELYEAEAKRTAELEAKVESLSPYEEQVSTYRETVESFANARMESLNLPRGVKSLVERMEPKERLDWITENEADFSGTTETIPPAPNGDDSGSTPEADEAAKRESQLHAIRTF